MEHERRADQGDLMHTLRNQNRILEEQTAALQQIIAFMAPMTEFFRALKVVGKFAAWITAAVATAVAAHEGIKHYFNGH